MRNIQSLSTHAVLAAALLVLAAPAAAQQVCTCDNTSDSVCVGGPTGNGTQAFEVTLVSFNINQGDGTSQWIYEICDRGPFDPDCPSDKALSHIDVVLGDLSACLNPGNEITFEKHADSAGDGAALSCVVENGDPSCAGEEGKVAKCDVDDSNPLDPGDCVQMELTVAGETAGLGAGAIQVQSKAGPACAINCLLGPSCQPCDPGQGDACLTRTPGFWGTHPHITGLFLPVTVCGEELSTTDAGSCASATEAMCVAPGKESKKNSAYAQLVRQLTAAKLNLAATAANGGSCAASDIEDRIAECEALYCSGKQSEISGSGCIEDLTGFNESLDTLPLTPAPFDRPGPAQPGECQEANGNGLVIGQGNCG